MIALALAEVDPSTAVPLTLAQPPPTPDDPGGRGADFGKSSPIGLLVLILFFIAVAFLVRSMTKHLKRVPASFDDPDEPAAPTKDQGQPDKPKGPADPA